jgi:hypothetical protein
MLMFNFRYIFEFSNFVCANFCRAAALLTRYGRARAVMLGLITLAAMSGAPAAALPYTITFDPPAGSVSFNTPVTIRARVTDSSGAPAPNVYVYMDHYASIENMTHVSHLVTDAAGDAVASITFSSAQYGASVPVHFVASSGIGGSSLSNFVTSTITLTAGNTLPGAPSGVSAVAGSGYATVSFNAPSYSGSPAATSYSVTSSPAGGSGTCSGPPCSVTGLTNGQSYTFTVRAVSSFGSGPASAASAPVTPRSNVAYLASLTPSVGALLPGFNPSGWLYNVAVPSWTTNISFVATPQDPNAQVRLNGGPSSTVIGLSEGVNTLIFTVTAADGVAQKLYKVSVYRPSSVTTLSALTLSSGTLSPAFSPGTPGYSASVANAVTAITVGATATDSAATVRVNGFSPGASIPLAIGGNTITVQVTAQDGVTRGTYTVTVTRAASSVATLSALTLSSGTLSPVFSPGTPGYSASVANAVTAITIGATATDSTATVRVNGLAPGASIPLAIGANTITVQVTAQDGVARGTYTVTVTRAASSVATLSALTLSAGTLSPSFGSATLAYTASVPNAVASVIVGATATDSTATVTVNGAAPGVAVALAVGNTAINVQVTAQDGVTRSAYTVTVTRIVAAPTISSLSLSVPFNSSGASIDLTASASGVVTSFTLAAVPAHGVATLSGTTVRYAPARGYSGEDSLVFTATGPGGTSGPATLSITVGARPDPSKDPQLAALVSAGLAAQRRMTQAQIGNVQRRLDALHEDVQAPVSMGLAFMSLDAPLSQQQRDIQSLRSMTDPLAYDWTAKPRPGSEVDKTWSAFPKTAAPRAGQRSAFSLWTGGNILYGSQRNANGDPQRDRFTSEGLTFGADFLAAPGLKVGLAAGLGGEDASLSGGANSRTRFGAFMGYASWQALNGIFVDALAGYGRGGIEARRVESIEDALLRSHRDTGSVFGSLSLTSEHRWGALKFAPFARIDVAWTSLGAATETGSDIAALRYDAVKAQSAAGVAGLRASYLFVTDWGRVEPRIRVEWRQSLEGSYRQNLSYADVIGGSQYVLTGASRSQGSILGALGLTIETENLLSVDIEYGAAPASVGGVRSQTVRATLRQAF